MSDQAGNHKMQSQLLLTFHSHEYDHTFHALSSTFVSGSSCRHFHLTQLQRNETCLHATLSRFASVLGGSGCMHTQCDMAPVWSNSKLWRDLQPSKPSGKWEAWEASYYAASAMTVLILGVGYQYRPKTSIKVRIHPCKKRGCGHACLHGSRAYVLWTAAGLGNGSRERTKGGRGPGLRSSSGV